jgi:hypothetical protein
VAYIVFVTVNGGLLNPDQPRTLADIRKLQEKHQIEQQQTATLFKTAKKPPSERHKRLGRAFEQGMNLVRSRVDIHREIAYGNQQPPEDYSTDYQEFLENHLANFPPEFRIRNEHVDDKTILFEPKYHYEILGGSAQPASEVFRAYLDKLIALQWKIGEVVFQESSGQGLLAAERGKWHITVGLIPEEIFTGYPVTVLWRMDRTDIWGDDVSYEFETILDTSEYMGW